MAAEGYESADILGTSFGGWVAQCFARASPHRVRRLVLSHTFTLGQRDAPAFRTGLAVWARIPRRLLLRLVRVRSIRALEPIRKYSTARYETAVATVRETLGAPSTFDVLISQNRAMLDSITALAHAQIEPKAQSPVLILESTDDPLISKRARKRLRESFPAASVHSFSGSGHVTALAEPGILAGVVEEFLGESSSGAPG
jgi:pimeloyl-ACP methyl ester carboxylesterase